MQYKFYVDGEWRHDEHQPFVNGNYGVVNTILLSSEEDMVPTVYTPEAPGRANMDVDNDGYMRLVRIFFFFRNWSSFYFLVDAPLLFRECGIKPKIYFETIQLIQ